ncbi:MAG: CRISPR-associated endonuclease Cas2 [Bacteroidota bacterium]|nr:CRISPR-associated endonuclease Cas2 [Bacteroidota bacterium]
MPTLTRLNQYRIMWLMVFFDLPTDRKKDRRNASLFRKRLLHDGFSMFQFSIYIRHCASRENLQVHIKRVKKILPPEGFVAMMQITDKQFGMVELFNGKKKDKPPEIHQQLTIF